MAGKMVYSVLIKQAKANQMEGTDWLLVVRKNRMEPIVVMDAERFFELLRERRKDNLC
jgi:hypothetical protein